MSRRKGRLILEYAITSASRYLANHKQWKRIPTSYVTILCKNRKVMKLTVYYKMWLAIILLSREDINVGLHEVAVEIRFSPIYKFFKIRINGCGFRH